jgi:hypothetical protein
MTGRRCPVCWSTVPDVPSETPFRTCSIRCRDRLQAAAERLLGAIAEPDELPTDERTEP